MDELRNALRVVLVGGAIGGVLGSGVALVIEFLRPRRACPACGHLLPRGRVPASFPNFFWGGWTCRCGCEVDYHGRKLGA